MVGKRFSPGSRIVKLVSETFPNRMENKKYLIYLLEKLILESKNIYATYLEQSTVTSTEIE